jgi:hypothetical protein
MNLRCIYCQTPFTLGRLEKLAAIQKLQVEELHHYDAFCPRCRRSNPVSIERLQIFTPGWQEGVRTLEAEAARMEQPTDEPAPAVPAAPVTATPSKKRHASKSEKKAPAPAVKKESPKPAAKKVAPKSSPKGKAKPAVKKPAAKKAAAKPKPKKK